MAVGGAFNPQGTYQGSGSAADVGTGDSVYRRNVNGGFYNDVYNTDHQRIASYYHALQNPTSTTPSSSVPNVSPSPVAPKATPAPSTSNNGLPANEIRMPDGSVAGTSLYNQPNLWGKSVPGQSGVMYAPGGTVPTSWAGGWNPQQLKYIQQHVGSEGTQNFNIDNNWTPDPNTAFGQQVLNYAKSATSNQGGIPNTYSFAGANPQDNANAAAYLARLFAKATGKQYGVNDANGSFQIFQGGVPALATFADQALPNYRGDIYNANADGTYAPTYAPLQNVTYPTYSQPAQVQAQASSTNSPVVSGASAPNLNTNAPANLAQQWQSLLPQNVLKSFLYSNYLNNSLSNS